MGPTNKHWLGCTDGLNFEDDEQETHCGDNDKVAVTCCSLTVPAPASNITAAVQLQCFCVLYYLESPSKILLKTLTQIILRQPRDFLWQGTVHIYTSLIKAPCKDSHRKWGWKRKTST